MQAPSGLVGLLVAFAAFNAGITGWFAYNAVLDISLYQAGDAAYTYVGSDYPLEYPIGDLGTVAMTLQESVHYTLNATSKEAHREWEILATYPKGVGRTRLGPEQRLFVMAFHHQIHCLLQIQRGLVVPDAHVTAPHLHHCLNYLRQSFLCVADDMLEEGDFMERDYVVERIGDSLVCQDWQKVYEVLDRRYDEWDSWRSLLN